MVLQLQFLRRHRHQALALAGLFLLGSSGAQAEVSAREHLKNARELYGRGQYFKAARYAFAAAQEAKDQPSESEAYSWVTMGLAEAGLPHAASYFYIRTLQNQDRASIRRALTQTERILTHVGGDLIKKYVLQHARIDDLEGRNRSAFLYLLGKDQLLAGNEAKASEYLSQVGTDSQFYSYSLELRATARAIRGDTQGALFDFENCAKRADEMAERAQAREGKASPEWVKESRARAKDLKARCQAGFARTLYQMERFEEAEEAYDQIPKASFVWTDILFEQGWNAFARGEYNHTLGKLVSYKSPALKFVHNSEVDVLRAQSFLALCLYDDANQVINEFNHRYTRVGEEVKRFVESQSGELHAFYRAGREALAKPLHTDNPFHRMLNRFVRGPYFQTMTSAEKAVSRELAASERFASLHGGMRNDPGQGFPGFLRRVLEWRGRTARQLGGIFVRNSLVDYHSVLISDFEKMAFIKLEMLSRAKAKLMHPDRKLSDRGRGNKIPERRAYQYYWTFNGEFWNDELGDYVFGLESECNS